MERTLLSALMKTNSPSKHQISADFEKSPSDTTTGGLLLVGGVIKYTNALLKYYPHKEYLVSLSSVINMVCLCVMVMCFRL